MLLEQSSGAIVDQLEPVGAQQHSAKPAGNNQCDAADAHQPQQLREFAAGGRLTGVVVVVVDRMRLRASVIEMRSSKIAIVIGRGALYHSDGNETEVTETVSKRPR